MSWIGQKLCIKWNINHCWLLVCILLTKIQYGCQKSKMAAAKIKILITWLIFAIKTFSWYQILGFQGQGIHLFKCKVSISYMASDLKHIAIYTWLKMCINLLYITYIWGLLYKKHSFFVNKMTMTDTYIILFFIILSLCH